jgi:prephenate dehydrogenase
MWSKVAIIGMGLMGGSIAKALKKGAPAVAIASLERDCPDLIQAVSEKTVDRVFASWDELIAWSELIILASPLSTLLPLAKEIAKRCPKEKKLLVIDVGSVKSAVFPAFEELTTADLEFLSTHPMAGKEKWGYGHSDENLFQGCSWILSPHAKNQSSTIEALSRLVELLGGKPVFLDPKKHDEQTALISHLPALLSRLLLKFVEETDKESLKIAGPGFKSMTRLAYDNPQLYEEIAHFNEKALSKQLALWLDFIKKEIHTQNDSKVG